ncbi:hypothetical protein Bealeia1_00269 [Candidatus Bealeia paramacronuclearis]|uniref:Uncharacterized protein n=1 Tax=Candidatus Bealeia paramacronuclearis TaxID=1921001 RepID=A0ABZ2C147_9PROT|nr:hypothetical protein [Candidatus Bealeia paramacronuclearis]
MEGCGFRKISFKTSKLKGVVIQSLLASTLLFSPLGATFETLVETLGLKKDTQVQTAKSKIGHLFQVEEDPKKAPSKNKVIQTTPLEKEILELHQKALLLQISDKDIWGDFLKNLSFFQGVQPSVHPAFRKNQIVEISKRVQKLQEAYSDELGKYFIRKSIPMIGEDLDTFQVIKTRYLTLFNIHSFIAAHWLTKEKSDFVAPCFILGTQLAQAKLIESVFEDEFQKQLTQQREERRKIKEEKERQKKEQAKNQKSEKKESDSKEETKEETPEIMEGPKIEGEIVEEKELPEITRSEITFFPSQVFESLKGHILPPEVNSWNSSFPLEFKDIDELIKKYQTPFDDLSAHIFPKQSPIKEEVKLDKNETEDEKKVVKTENLKLEEEAPPKDTKLELKNSKLEEEDTKKTPPFEILEKLKIFRHPGIFSTLMNQHGFEVADQYLFLKSIQLLKSMTTDTTSEKLTQKLKLAWNLHTTKGKEKNSQTSVSEEFLKAFSNWAAQNKELDIHRLKFNESSPLEMKYAHFMKQHGPKFLKMLEEKKEKEAQQLINMIVGTDGWKHHQSTLSKKEPQEKVTPLEEELRKAWTRI